MAERAPVDAGAALRVVDLVDRVPGLEHRQPLAVDHRAGGRRERRPQVPRMTPHPGLVAAEHRAQQLGLGDRKAEPRRQVLVDEAVAGAAPPRPRRLSGWRKPRRVEYVQTCAKRSNRPHSAPAGPRGARVPARPAVASLYRAPARRRSRRRQLSRPAMLIAGKDGRPRRSTIAIPLEEAPL